MAKCYGKYMVRLARTLDRDSIENICIVFVDALPSSLEILAIVYPRRSVPCSCSVTTSSFRYLEVSYISTIVLGPAVPSSWFF